MKANICGAFLLSLILVQIHYNSLLANAVTSAVTYDLGDRLGDNLASYCHAKWYFYIYDIPLLYQPFKYSEHLMLSKINKRRDNKQFKNVISYPQRLNKKVDISSLNIQKNSETLYVIPFFPDITKDAIKFGFIYFDINWADEKFLAQLREDIKPINPIPQLQLPSNVTTVCVHVRKGSGPDGTIYKLDDFPMKFPPDNFYIEQIKRVSQHFQNKPLYVHIFTDYKKPDELVEKYKAVINLPNITYNCCVMKTDSELVLLEDFFNMTLFDCIIRPASALSLIASKLSHAKIVIYPTDYKMEMQSKKNKKKNRKRNRKKEQRQWVITQVATEIRK